MKDEGGGMTPRERVKAAIQFKKPDILPWIDWFHPEAINRWFLEGLKPEDVAVYGFTPSYKLFIGIMDFYYYDLNSYFGCVNLLGCQVGLETGPMPIFRERVLSEDEKYQDLIIWTGTRAKQRKTAKLGMPGYSMAMFTEFPVKDKKSWEEYKKRLNPKDPKRYPLDWDKDVYIEVFENFQGGNTAISCSGFYGFGAQIMGIPNFNLAFHKDPELIEEMAEYWEYFTIEMLRDAVETLKDRIDLVWYWEDMASKHGPNISPRFYKEFILPHTKNVTAFLRKNKVDNVMMDSDGNINPLLDLYIEAGIKGIWPLEVNSFMDAVEIRKKYGNKLFLGGGLDKREISKGGEAMRKEVDSKLPFLKETSGFLPGVDHLIHSEFSYATFKEYADYIMKQLPY